MSEKALKKERYVMCAVMLLFAFTMSLVINYAEKLIIEHKDQPPAKTETEEVLATEKPE